MTSFVKNQNAIINGNVIANSTAKTTPVDADSVGISDSADSGILKKLTWANIVATIKAAFATMQTVSTSEANEFGNYAATPRQGVTGISLAANSTYLITASVYQAGGNAGLTYLSANISNTSATLSVVSWGAIGRTYSFQNCAATEAMFVTLCTTRTTTSAESIYLSYQVDANTGTGARTYCSMTATRLK